MNLSILKETLILGLTFGLGLRRNMPRRTGAWGLEPLRSQALENIPGQLEAEHDKEGLQDNKGIRLVEEHFRAFSGRDPERPQGC